MDTPQNKPETTNGNNGCCPCGKSKCCCKMFAALLLLLVGGAVGYFFGRHCTTGRQCPFNMMGAQAPSNAPAAPTPAK